MDNLRWFTLRRKGAYFILSHLLEPESIGFRFHISGRVLNKQFQGILTLFHNDKLYKDGYDYYYISRDRLCRNSVEINHVVRAHQDWLDSAANLEARARAVQN